MEAIFSAPIGALLIFFLRIIDVSMAMMRMILAVRGYRITAASIGFFEVLIWLVAAGHALNHLDSWMHIVGFAGGFAAGNYVGVWLESRFALGLNVVQAVFRSTPEQSIGPETARILRERGFAVTEVMGKGRESAVDILSVVVQRKRVPEVTRIMSDLDPQAFVSVEEVRATHGGYVRPGGRKMPFLTQNLITWPRGLTEKGPVQRPAP
jgi:uncharacterized protein YebE (UPF0316 family)